MPIITPLPTPPSRAGDSPAVFADKADAFLGALPAMATQMNATASAVEALAGLATNGGGIPTGGTPYATSAITGADVVAFTNIPPCYAIDFICSNVTIVAADTMELQFSSNNGISYKASSGEYFANTWNGSAYASDPAQRAAWGGYNNGTAGLHFAGRIMAAGANTPSVTEANTWGTGGEVPARVWSITSTAYIINAIRFRTFGGENFTAGSISIWLRW